MTGHSQDGSAGGSTPCQPGRPLRRDAELNRQKILRAAAEVFASRGLSVTLDDIADHAGVGVGTVYRRFPTKDALIEALFEDKIDHLVCEAEVAATQGDAWAALIQFLRSAVMRQARDRGLRQVMHNSGYGHDRVARARGKLAGPVEAMIQAAKAQGSLRTDFEITDVPILLMMMGSVAQYTCTADPSMWLRYLDMFIDGMRRRPDLTEAACPALTESQLNSVMHQQLASSTDRTY